MDSIDCLKEKFFLKYAFDKISALLGLIFLSPILFLIGLIIWIEGLLSPQSRGPVIIHDIRISQHRAFPLWKFRTSRQDSEIAIDNPVHTRVGKVLLKFYLDEFPQLLNILLGHMSFVGPRPTPRIMYKNTLKAGYKNKRVLRAGLCGPVQYLKGKWSKIGKYLSADEALIGEYETRNAIGIVILDVLIMWLTFKKVLEGDGLENPAR